MKELFFEGGWEFMTLLTILFVIITAWIIYHFYIAYISKHTNQEKYLRRIGYGKTMGLFTLIVGIFGQMMGFYSMFLAIEELVKNGAQIMPHLVFRGIKATMIVTFYGILIYLWSLLLWFVASILIENKLDTQDAA